MLVDKERFPQLHAVIKKATHNPLTILPNGMGLHSAISIELRQLKREWQAEALEELVEDWDNIYPGVYLAPNIDCRIRFRATELRESPDNA